jgi:hypothetical protein
VEYFCAAKPQKCDLKPVQWSEAERCCNALLSEALLCDKREQCARKLFLAKRQPKFPTRAKQKNNNPILRKDKPKRKQRKEKTKTNETKNTATDKTTCDFLRYRRHRRKQKKHNNEIT